MKMLCMLMLSLFCATLGVQSTTAEVKTNSIVMEDTIMMFTSSDNPEDPIATIEVFDRYGDLKLVFNDCTGYECTRSLAPVPPGIYTVRVTTQSGQVENGQVQRG